MKIVEIEYLDIKPNKKYEDIINDVMYKCFEKENLFSKNLYVNIILTSPSKINEINLKYRNIDKSTDVLSFPIFEKGEIDSISGEIEEVLGDIVISIEQVIKQGREFGHGFNRELSYMVVHGFYHLMGYDHINDEDKKIMRMKEEEILSKQEI